MGNIAEAGGFGDTRLPTDGDEMEEMERMYPNSISQFQYEPGARQSIMNESNMEGSEYTYRDGVNYRRHPGSQISQLDGRGNYSFLESSMPSSI